MQLVDRRWRQKMAALAFLLALLACWLVTGSLITIFSHVLLILWLWVSSYVVYRAFFYWHIHWNDDLLASGPEKPTSIQEESAEQAPAQAEPVTLVTPSVPGYIIIGEAFYCATDRSEPQPGLLSFLEGSLYFSGAIVRVFDLRELSAEQGEASQILIDDRAYGSPICGHLLPHHQVRLVSGTGEESAAFLMPMAQAQFLAGLVREYLNERQPGEDTYRLFLANLGAVVGQWRQEGKAQAIAQALLQKLNPINLQNPELLMSIEHRLRDRLPNGQLGYRLFWVSAYQATVQTGVQGPDTHAEEARSFYHDAFRPYVRLLAQDCPTGEYPFIVYAHAAWLLLRESAAVYFAASLWDRIRPTDEQDPTAFSLSSIIDAYVEKHDEQTAYVPENLLQLAYLLAHLGLIAAPVAYPEPALKPVYDQTKNVLLLQDAVQLQISNAWKRVQLERFERDLFSPAH